MGPGRRSATGTDLFAKPRHSGPCKRSYRHVFSLKVAARNDHPIVQHHRTAILYVRGIDVVGSQELDNRINRTLLDRLDVSFAIEQLEVPLESSFPYRVRECLSGLRN